MNKIKDLIYDKNDILIALLIIVVAGLVIWSRIDVIIAYPAQLTAQAEANAQKASQNSDSEQEQNNNDDDSDAENNGDQTDPGENEPSTDQPTGTDQPTDPDQPLEPLDTPVSVVIPSGANTQKIGEILVEAGLVSNSTSFVMQVTSSGKDTRLQAGTFSIPADSTLDEIITILTSY